MPRVEVRIEVDTRPFYVADPTEDNSIRVTTDLLFDVGQGDPSKVRAELRRLADRAADQYAASVGGGEENRPEREGGDAGSGQ